MSMTPDEMIAVIQAHQRGEEIQFRVDSVCKWQDTDNPLWNFDTCEYRVKPEPTPDIIRYIRADLSWGSLIQEGRNLRLIFDEETGELKAAEVLS